MHFVCILVAVYTKNVYKYAKYNRGVKINKRTKEASKRCLTKVDILYKMIYNREREMVENNGKVDK
ncbi:MAG TPA: hypothetical protein DEB74_17075 [Lachnospiraceae bacterium]|nr:hypothetical protein [Lachnospiraceae bacterium]